LWLIFILYNNLKILSSKNHGNEAVFLEINADSGDFLRADPDQKISTLTQNAFKNIINLW
jgi:hypothetical protein